ncbi:unnamed protein product [Phytophthora fragariaefolia]|uniref:Unnamed protein product n=1 Tax=Phytophthora fragariaefolia TaxID=1490495 RepID=A0A9W6U0I5_9STRA|nr:unnamed protein product [Phytophthora fragariaefolia]
MFVDCQDQEHVAFVLAVLPGHLWGSTIVFTPEEFTVDKVETKLSAIFGAKSRGEISDLAKGVRVAHVDAVPAKPGITGKPSGTAKLNVSVLGKRKAPPVPEQDSHYNFGAMSCHYFAGMHNKMYGIGPHLKFQCPKRAKDHAQKVYRRDIWSTPKGIPKQHSSEPTPKMKGKCKRKAKAVRKEMPTEDCRWRIESTAMMLEDTVRSLYPFLLNLDDALTSDSWVLDSGCGFGLTSDASKLVEHRPDNGYMFTFAEGSKHMNTHVGTVKLYLHSPKGIKPFLFENIALVPLAKSNILSEIWLNRLNAKGFQRTHRPCKHVS